MANDAYRNVKGAAFAMLTSPGSGDSREQRRDDGGDDEDEADAAFDLPLSRAAGSAGRAAAAPAAALSDEQLRELARPLPGEADLSVKSEAELKQAARLWRGAEGMAVQDVARDLVRRRQLIRGRGAAARAAGEEGQTIDALRAWIVLKLRSKAGSSWLERQRQSTKVQPHQAAPAPPSTGANHFQQYACATTSTAPQRAAAGGQAPRPLPAGQRITRPMTNGVRMAEAAARGKRGAARAPPCRQFQPPVKPAVLNPPGELRVYGCAFFSPTLRYWVAGAPTTNRQLPTTTTPVPSPCRPNPSEAHHWQPGAGDDCRRQLGVPAPTTVCCPDCPGPPRISGRRFQPRAPRLQPLLQGAE